MLSTVIALALRFRTLVIFAAGVLLVLGLRAAEKTPLDVFPEFAQPMIEIQTEAPGLSTEEVESLVTLPLETALAGLPCLCCAKEPICYVPGSWPKSDSRWKLRACPVWRISR